jgi:acetolactate synthase-1/2/3 large subunit
MIDETSNGALTVSQVLLHYLTLEGTDFLFGVPGGALANLLVELKNQRDRFRFVICRHETGAAYMADGYFRATGKLGVIMVTSGPGATNALTGTMNAHNSGAPLLTLTGEVAEATYGRGYLQEGIDAMLDVNSIYAAATAYSAVVADQSDCQALIAQALRCARSIPHRASHLSMPNNVAAEVVVAAKLPEHTHAYRTVPHGVSREDAREVLLSLLAAERPLIMLGNGCREAFRGQSGQTLMSLVERYGIPVMTTCDGKGIFPESHPLSLRVYGVADCMWPQYWLKQPEDMPQYDALLILGSSLGELSTNSWAPMLIPQGPIYQVDLDQNVVGRGFPLTRGVIAEVGAFVEELATLAKDLNPDVEKVNARKTLLAQLKLEHSPYISPEQYNSESSPIEPASLIRIIQDTLPKDALLFIDAGNCVGWAAHYFDINPPQELFSCLSMGPMGYAVGAVVGAKLGAPNRTCLALVGDGAFMMHAAEVSTASANRVGAVWIVLNDNDLRMVSQGMQHFFPDTANPPIWDELYTLGAPDLAKVAEGFGAQTYTVQKPTELAKLLPKIFKQADSGKPQVIIANIERRSVPPYYNPQYI